MHWLYTHIDHFTAPLGGSLGLLAAYIGFTVQRNRKLGLPLPELPKAVQAGLIILVVVSAFLVGVAFVRNFA